MKLVEFLEGKLGKENLKTVLGEDGLTSIADVEVQAEGEELLATNLLSLLDAENSVSIIEKNKDKWHKETKKGFMDSIDSVLGEDLDEDTAKINDTKEKIKAILANKRTTLATKEAKIAELEEKIKNGSNAADVTALLKDKEAIIESMKLTMVDKSAIKEATKELKALQDKLTRRDNKILQNKIVSTALENEGLVAIARKGDLRDTLITTAVNKYLADKRFGNDGAEAMMVLDEDTNEIVIRNKADNNVAVVNDGVILTLSALVNASLLQYDLIEKKDTGKHQFVPDDGVPKSSKVSQAVKGLL